MTLLVVSHNNFANSITQCFFRRSRGATTSQNLRRYHDHPFTKRYFPCTVQLKRGGSMQYQALPCHVLTTESLAKQGYYTFNEVNISSTTSQVASIRTWSITTLPQGARCRIPHLVLVIIHHLAPLPPNTPPSGRTSHAKTCPPTSQERPCSSSTPPAKWRKILLGSDPGQTRGEKKSNQTTPGK